eukprot:6213584-Lingulodinium_polyedra.AAC.1
MVRGMAAESGAEDIEAHDVLTAYANQDHGEWRGNMREASPTPFLARMVTATEYAIASGHPEEPEHP